MQEWLDNNDILMYSMYNEGKSVIAESFIKILKAKIHIKMTANDSKSYLSYMNKLVGQYNNTFKAPKFKVNDRVRIIKYNIFSRGYTRKIG